MRLGLVAAGCAIGVAASSSVFLVMSGLNGSDSSESASLVSEEPEVANQTAEEAPQLAGNPAAQPGDTDQSTLSATVFDTQSDGGAAEADVSTSEDLASLTVPSTGADEQTSSVEPQTLPLAPSVRSFVPKVGQPPLQISLLSYRPREEVNLGFVQLQTTPEIFSTSVALLESTVAAAEPVETATQPRATVVPPEEAPDLVATLTRRAPVMPIQPGAMVYEGSKVPVDDLLSLRQQARAYQPELRNSTVAATGQGLLVPDIVASLDIEVPPETPVLAEPEANGVITASLDPIVQTEEPVGAAETEQSDQAEVQPQAIELAALPSTPEAPTLVAPLAIPLPTEIPSVAVASIPPDTPVTLEDLVPSQTPTLPIIAEPLPQVTPGVTQLIERTALLEDEAATLSEPSPASTSEPAPASTVVAFRLYAPTNVPQGVVDSVVADLTTTGHELSGQARVGFGISQSNVRFYHKQDEERAAALAKDAGALLRDFTGANTKTPSGVIELWLAGESVAVAAARPATPRRATPQPTTRSAAVQQTTRGAAIEQATRNAVRAPKPKRVNRLRNQVLNKLKRANQ